LQKCEGCIQSVFGDSEIQQCGFYLFVRLIDSGALAWCCGRCTKISRWPLLRLATLIITSIRVLYAGRVPCQCQYPPASRTRIEEMRLLKDDGEKNCAAANIHDCRDSRRCSTCKRRRGYRYTNDC